MGNVVSILENADLGFQFNVNLGKSNPNWVNLNVGYMDNARRGRASIFGWNGNQLSANMDKKRLIQDRPDVFMEVAAFVEYHSVQSLVDHARCKDCRVFDLARIFPRPAMEYSAVDGFDGFILEPATHMHAGPWLNLRVLGMGKRGPRKFYFSWNGSKIKGKDWATLWQMHPHARDRIELMLSNSTPTQLCSFARYTETMSRLAA
jgi:hypothetical protein